MMVQSDRPPQRGSYVEIVRPTCSITGRVVWSKDGRFGIQTRERVCIESLLERRKIARGESSGAPLVQAGSTQTASLPDSARRGDMARRFAGRFQQGVLLAGAALGAISAATILYGNLAHAFADVSTALR